MSTLTAVQIKSIKGMIQQDLHSRSAERKGLSTDIKANKTLIRAQEKFPNLDGVLDLATIKKLIKEVREDMDKSADYDEVVQEEYDYESSKKKKRVSKASTYNTGKFSNDESELIDKKISDYCVSMGLSLSDVIIGLRDVDAPNKKKESHSIWAELAEAMPLRNPKAIYQHANRKFTMKAQQAWTPEDKDRLKLLVEEKGNKWSEIGRLMGRLGDDCKHVYRRFRERTKKGRFSEEEDIQLTLAIKKVSSLPFDHPNQDLPTKDISWTRVAAEMKNERLDIDYLRRWQTVKSSFAVTDMQSEILVSSEPLKRKKVHIYSNSKGNDVAYKIVRYLAGKEGEVYNHESEVIWADIDRKYNLPYAFAAHKWKFLQSDLPTDMKAHPFKERIEYFLTKYEKLVDPSMITSGNPGSSSNNNSGMADDDETSEDEDEAQKVRVKKAKN